MITIRGRTLTRGEAAAYGLSGLAMAYFVFWACAPTTYVDPGGPVPAEHMTLGAAGSVTAIPGGKIDSGGDLAPAVDSQFWARYQFESASLGISAFAGETSLIGGGLMGRLSLLKNEDVDLSLEGQLGWLWGALAVPMSFKMSDGLWFFTSPSIGNRLVTVQLPVGVAIDLTDNLFLTLSGGIESDPDQNNIDNLRLTDLKSYRGAIGLQYHFSTK